MSVGIAVENAQKCLAKRCGTRRGVRREEKAASKDARFDAHVTQIIIYLPRIAEEIPGVCKTKEALDP